MKPKLTPHTLRLIAVASAVDPRTVARYIANENSVRALSRERIERVLRKRPHLRLVHSK
jgi:DNA-binding LacI/PurR family transcriptional regulator